MKTTLLRLQSTPLFRALRRNDDERPEHLLDAARTGDATALDDLLAPATLRKLNRDQAGRLAVALANAERWDQVRHVAAARPLPKAARRTALKVAASSGRPELVEALATPDDDPGVIAYRLGRAYETAQDWERAAEAYCQALLLRPDKGDWRSRFDRMRHKAPRWGFYARDPALAWQLTETLAAEPGLVAPVHDCYVTGWLAAGQDPDPAVVIKLNDTTIATARATNLVTLPDGRDYIEFHRELADLGSYAGAGDVLTVEHQGQPLPIVGSGRAYAFPEGESDAERLARKIANGYVLNKYGKVQKPPSINHEWQARIRELYDRLRKDIHDEFGIKIFPIYGTLLGAVREQNFIGHDNDFDTVYISDRTKPAEVRHQFVELCHFLISKGYEIRVMKTHVWVRIPGTRSNRYKIDIFFGWFDADDQFRISYGHHGTPVRRSPEFFQFRSQQMGDFEVQVPENAENLLAQLFGDGWRVPDPGFSHASSTRVRDENYLLSPRELNELYWSQFYRDRTPGEPSTFAEFVMSRLTAPGLVIELGCGTGRDSVYFARRGWRVWAADRALEAVEVVRRAATDQGTRALQVESVDAASGSELRRFLSRAVNSAAPTDRLVVYLRFFLHAIDEETQETVLDSLTRSIRRPFTLCAEFRTTEDRSLVKVHGQHYRRYIDPHALGEQLTSRWGLEIQHFETGRGLSPYDGEDPHLARIIARSVRHEVI